MSKEINRRRFLRKVATFLAALALALAACTPGGLPTTTAPTLSETPTATPEPTATRVPPTETPTPIIEPTLPAPAIAESILPVNPPMDFHAALTAQAEIAHGSFDLTDAHAVYAYYRQQQGPQMWPNNDQFVADMEAYYHTLQQQGVDIVQTTDPDNNRVTYTMLTRNGREVLLGFNPNGTLADFIPGHWSKDTDQQWVDMGGPVAMVIGPDQLPYLVRLNQNQEVTAFFNPLGATRANIDQQWLAVSDGQPIARWDSTSHEWLTAVPVTFIADWSGHGSFGGYTWLTKEQIVAYPSTITWADIDTGLYGPMFKQELRNDTYFLWLVGEVVGAQSGQYTGADGKPYKIVEVVIDVPVKYGDRWQTVRFVRTLDSFMVESGSMYELNAIRNNIDALRQQGVDPLADPISMAQFPDRRITFYDPRFYPRVHQDPSTLIGDMLGLAIYSRAGLYSGGPHKAVRVDSNPVIPILLNQQPGLTQADIHLWHSASSEFALLKP